MKIEGKHRIIATVMLIVLALTSFGAASFLIPDNKEKDRNTVVAEVNGENILYGEVQDVYEQQLLYYGISEADQNNPEQAESIKNMKSMILENLIYERLVMQKARETGYTVTDEVLEQAEVEFDGILEDVAEQLKAQAAETEGQDGDESVDYMERAREYVDNELKNLGKTRDQYINMMAEYTVVEKFMDDVIKDIQGTDEDMLNYYNTQLEIQKESPSSSDGWGVELYRHTGVRVKHILVALPEDQKTEYNRLLSEGKEEEAKAFLDEKLKAIYPKAQEVYDKARSGEDFEKLIEEYGEDPGMVDNEQGYIVHQDGEFVKEFEDAALGLMMEEISLPVASAFGYHIIKAYEKIPEKIFSFEEKKEEIKSIVDAQKKSEKWDADVEEWMKTAVINRYEDRL